MAPRRTRARKPVTTDPKQRSIADFFAPKVSPSPSPFSTPSKTRPVSETPSSQPSKPKHVSQTPRPAKPAPAKLSTTALHDAQQIRAANISSPKVVSIRDRVALPSLRKRVQVTDDVDVDMTPPIDHLAPSPNDVVADGMPMHADTAVSSDPDDDKPLTQEELQVHDQLQALECSRGSPDHDIIPTARPSNTEAHPSRTISKRKRSAATAFADDKFSTPGPLTSTGYMFDSDDDETTPTGLKKEPSLEGTTASGEEDDDSDDEELNVELRKHQHAVATRRSSRISKEVVRFDPNADVGYTARGASVFGGSLFGEGRSSHAATSALRAIMRERGARERQEIMVAEMRQDVAVGTDILNEKEAVFDTMAKEEDKREQQRQANLEKYSAPIPLFTSAPQHPELKSKYLRKQTGQVSWHSLHHILMGIFRSDSDSDIALSLFPALIAKSCSEGQAKTFFGIADIIFHLLVYDDTDCGPGSVARDGLLESLTMLCRKGCVEVGQGRLPTLVTVLESYGAFFEDSGVPEVHTRRPVCEDSLDALGKAETCIDRSEKLAKAARNLGRACTYAAERIRNNDKLHRVISRKASKKDKPSAILYSLGICARVLMSTFGTRLFREVGSVIGALLSRVEDSHWPHFRIRAARYLLSITTRLGLHVELVTYLLPYDTERSRAIALDIGYLSLVQWCSGPGENPKPRNIHAREPSAKAKAYGLADISFCLSDLVELTNNIPDFQKTTDTEWACGIAKILKQVLLDGAVLDRREKGELRFLHQNLSKLRTCAHRLEFGVPLQDMRLALDALLMALRELLGNSKSVVSEISPKARFDMVQSKLPGSTS